MLNLVQIFQICDRNYHIQGTFSISFLPFTIQCTCQVLMILIIAIYCLSSYSIKSIPNCLLKKKCIVSPKGHLIYFTLLLLQESLHHIIYFTIHHFKIIFFFTPNTSHVCFEWQKKNKKGLCLFEMRDWERERIKKGKERMHRLYSII